MLDADRTTLLDHALDHCPIDPTFGPFVSWARGSGIEVVVASDGFGFYIGPLLAAEGLPSIRVVSNEQLWSRDRPAGLRFPNGHHTCVGCGTCKKQAVERARAEHGAVAFVGDGVSDRFGARYADLTFAKHHLAQHCREEGIPFLPYRDFDDVRAALEAPVDVPGPLDGEPCPGWRER